MENQLEVKLTELSGAIKAHVDKYNAETATQGTATKETRELLDKLIADHADTKKQLDAIDEKIQVGRTGPAAKTLSDTLKENDGLLRLVKDGKGHAIINIPLYQLKTTMTTDNVGATPRQTTGVLPIERLPGITAEARRPLLYRDMLSSRTTDRQVVDDVRVANALADAATQSPEGGAKSENALTFTSQSEKLKTIATWIPVSRQLLKFMPELENFLRTSLMYYVEKETEDQLLNGNGAGETLRGHIPQATSFNTALLPGAAVGWTLLDVVGWAAGQVAIANEIPPTFVVLHPQDWWDARMTKDTQGRYILGNPWSSTVPNLFDMRPVPTTAIAQGTFLVGSGSPEATELVSGGEVQVEISTEHAEYFTKNLVAIRAEQMLALVTKRPASFITGSTTTSPA